MMIWGNTREWLKNHHTGQGWIFKGEYKHPKSGLPIALLYNENSFHPWSVQYAGSGHYFKELWQAEAWADERMGRP